MGGQHFVPYLNGMAMYGSLWPNNSDALILTVWKWFYHFLFIRYPRIVTASGILYIYIIDLSEPAVPIFASVVRGFCRRPCFFGHQKRSRRPASTRAFRLLSEMETDTVEIPQPSWKVLGIMWWLLLTMVVITIWLFNIAMENDNF